MRSEWGGRLAIAALVASWVIPISLLVNRIVPDPYMDEIFHIPQAQQYCKGNFRSWDPMITTPPGLYCLSLIHVACTFSAMWLPRRLESFSMSCSTTILRSTNGVLAAICSVLIFELLSQLRPALTVRRRVAFTLLLSLYPIHWFFTFLYYTDMASVTAVLALYLACLKRHYWLSAMFGSLAMFIRQTNVIWVLFIASNGAIDFATYITKKDQNHPDQSLITSGQKETPVNYDNRAAGLALRKRKMNASFHREDMSFSQSTSSIGCTPGMIDEAKETLAKMWCLKWKILKLFLPFILISGAFGIFVILNGSVVLGAKDAHTVSPHFAQLFYFGFVSAAAMYPVHFSSKQAMSLFKSICACKLPSCSLWFFALLLGLISIKYFSIAHPYLLADNRHYTFYLWRKVTKSHWLTKYLLIPLYVYSWFSILTVLGKTQKRIWCLLFFLACAAVLVPAPLIEFRYYTIPFYLIVLNSKIDDANSWFLMAIVYVAVNIFTMTMFLLRPFHWDHEPGTQRFLW